ncbi:MAG: hypothetical protein JSV31_28740 [Desulfobacterales bacterium]|nr:MAG: hypothetical protein JSV31_28740 [Desulfobacterales bacterium]
MSKGEMAIRQLVGEKVVQYGHAEDHPGVSLNPDNYSKFSQEAMKYVENHF